MNEKLNNELQGVIVHEGKPGFGNLLLANLKTAFNFCSSLRSGGECDTGLIWLKMSDWV